MNPPPKSSPTIPGLRNPSPRSLVPPPIAPLPAMAATRGDLGGGDAYRGDCVIPVLVLLPLLLLSPPPLSLRTCCICGDADAVRATGDDTIGISVRTGNVAVFGVPVLGLVVAVAASVGSSLSFVLLDAFSDSVLLADVVPLPPFGNGIFGKGRPVGTGMRADVCTPCEPVG